MFVLTLLVYYEEVFRYEYIPQDVVLISIEQYMYNIMIYVLTNKVVLCLQTHLKLVTRRLAWFVNFYTHVLCYL